MDRTTDILLIILTAAIALSVLIQLGAILAILIATRKTQKKIHALIEDFRIHGLPAISAVRSVVEDLSPKIKVVSSNLVTSSNQVQLMAGEVTGVVSEIAARVRGEAAHLDALIQGVLSQIDEAAQVLQRGIATPLRQVSGVLNGLRASFNALRQRRSPDPSEAETDLFV